MLFHSDIIDVHNSDIASTLPSCIFLFFSPNSGRICACRSVYALKCCQTERCPRKCPVIVLRYGVDFMDSVSFDTVPLRWCSPKLTSFFQFELFMWSSITSLRCDVDIPLVLLEISFSGAQSVSIVSPSICQPPSIKLGEYLARQVSRCPWIWKRLMPNLSSRPSGILRCLLPATLSFI